MERLGWMGMIPITAGPGFRDTGLPYAGETPKAWPEHHSLNEMEMKKILNHFENPDI